jgi:hypothetical protein
MPAERWRIRSSAWGAVALRRTWLRFAWTVHGQNHTTMPRHVPAALRECGQGSIDADRLEYFFKGVHDLVNWRRRRYLACHVVYILRDKANLGAATP